MNIGNTISSLECYLKKVLQDHNSESKHLSGAGATYLFEQKLKQFYGKKYVLTFSNATTAIFSLCIAANLKKSEIITSPINFGGSIGPLIALENTLSFTAIQPHSLNMNADSLSDVLTAETRAVLSVDYNGTPADSRKIKEFCVKNNLFYISDSAQGFGAFRNSKPAGYYADAIVLSFSPGKSLFGGEGGAILTDDKELYESLISISQHPSRQKAVLGISNYNEYTALNGRLNPFSAIVLNETFKFSLKKLEVYQNLCFKTLQKLTTENLIEYNPFIKTPNSSTYFEIILRPKAKVNIEVINKFLAAKSLPFICRSHFVNLIPSDENFHQNLKSMPNISEKLTYQSDNILNDSSYMHLYYSANL